MILEQPTDESGLPKAHVCALCNEEFSHNELAITLTYGIWYADQLGMTFEPNREHEDPIVHERCLRRLLNNSSRES